MLFTRNKNTKGFNHIRREYKCTLATNQSAFINILMSSYK